MVENRCDLAQGALIQRKIRFLGIAPRCPPDVAIREFVN